MAVADDNTEILYWYVVGRGDEDRSVNTAVVAGVGPSAAGFRNNVTTGGVRTTSSAVVDGVASRPSSGSTACASMVCTPSINDDHVRVPVLPLYVTARDDSVDVMVCTSLHAASPSNRICSRVPLPMDARDELNAALALPRVRTANATTATGDADSRSVAKDAVVSTRLSLVAMTDELWFAWDSSVNGRLSKLY